MKTTFFLLLLVACFFASTLSAEACHRSRRVKSCFPVKQVFTPKQATCAGGSCKLK